MNTNPTISSSEQNSSGSTPCKKQLSFLADVDVMKQPTATANEASEKSAPFTSSVPASSQRPLHPGLLNDLLARVDLTKQRIKTVANKTTVSVNSKKHMKIVTNITNKQVALMPEGTYAAVVKAIDEVEKLLKDGDKPELKIAFTVAGAVEPMAKKYPASMGERSPLKREAQAILGRNLSVPELQSFDTDQLLNRNCQVVVVHQHNGGSKPKAVIKTVLAAPLASTPVATTTPAVETTASA